MRTDLAYGRLPAESEDHFLGLADARLVSTETVLNTQDNIESVIAAKAMMCAYGAAGFGKTIAVNSALRALAPHATYRLELRAGPTARDIRHGLFRALHLPGEPPHRPIEFDALLKDALAERFRVLVRRSAVDEPDRIRVLAPPVGREAHRHRHRLRRRRRLL
jgi:hypothetical protein